MVIKTGGECVGHGWLFWVSYILALPEKSPHQKGANFLNNKVHENAGHFTPDATRHFRMYLPLSMWVIQKFSDTRCFSFKSNHKCFCWTRVWESCNPTDFSGVAPITGIQFYIYPINEIKHLPKGKSFKWMDLNEWISNSPWTYSTSFCFSLSLENNGV